MDGRCFSFLQNGDFLRKRNRGACVTPTVFIFPRISMARITYIEEEATPSQNSASDRGEEAMHAPGQDRDPNLRDDWSEENPGGNA